MAENRGILGDTWAFTKAAGSGAWDAGADIVEDVGDLAKSGYELATDSKARESAWETTKQLAEKAGDYGEAVIDDPAKPYRDARDGTIAAYDRFKKNKELATKESRLSEFYGEMAGSGAVEVGSILIPAGAVAKAGKLGKAVNVVDDLGASKKAKGVLGGSAVKQLDDHVSPIQKCPVKDGAKKVKLTYPVETKPNEAFFWSGRTNGLGGENIAKDIAEQNHGTTLETLIEKRNIEMPKWNATNPEIIKAWKDISADYAKGSSGTVRGVIGKDLRLGNVWETSELPALKNNPNVDKIITIDPVTKVETEIFTRGAQ